jgi:nucleoside 2-deoxyribosyltransferase
MNISVYLAGPFTDPEWRNALLEGRRGIELNAGELAALRDHQAFRTVPQVVRGGFDLTGPWRVNRDGNHGLASGHPGRDARGCACCDSDLIVAVCRQAIAASDFVFCWLTNTPTVPAGTLWELGYADALGKPIVLARPERDSWDGDDYWFPIAAADLILLANDPEYAWEELIGLLPRLLRRSRRSHA